MREYPFDTSRFIIDTKGHSEYFHSKLARILLLKGLSSVLNILDVVLSRFLLIKALGLNEQFKSTSRSLDRRFHTLSYPKQALGSLKRGKCMHAHTLLNQRLHEVKLENGGLKRHKKLKSSPTLPLVLLRSTIYYSSWLLHFTQRSYLISFPQKHIFFIILCRYCT